jgi:hypothetical protein
MRKLRDSGGQVSIETLNDWRAVVKRSNQEIARLKALCRMQEERRRVEMAVFSEECGAGRASLARTGGMALPVRGIALLLLDCRTWAAFGPHVCRAARVRQWRTDLDGRRTEGRKERGRQRGPPISPRSRRLIATWHCRTSSAPTLSLLGSARWQPKVSEGCSPGGRAGRASPHFGPLDVFLLRADPCS